MVKFGTVAFSAAWFIRQGSLHFYSVKHKRTKVTVEILKPNSNFLCHQRRKTQSQTVTWPWRVHMMPSLIREMTHTHTHIYTQQHGMLCRWHSPQSVIKGSQRVKHSQKHTHTHSTTISNFLPSPRQPCPAAWVTMLHQCCGLLSTHQRHRGARTKIYRRPGLSHSLFDLRPGVFT